MMVMSMWVICVTLLSSELDQPLKILYKGLGVFNKEDITVSQGRLIGIVKASVEFRSRS